MSSDDLATRLRDYSARFTASWSETNITGDLLREAADALSRPVAAELPVVIRHACGLCGMPPMVEESAHQAALSIIAAKEAEIAQCSEAYGRDVTSMARERNEALGRVDALEAALKRIGTYPQHRFDELSMSECRKIANEALKGTP